MDNLKDTYYHYTSYNSMSGIAQDGLVPNIGVRSMTKFDDRGGVFLSKGIFSSIKMYSAMLSFYNKYSGDNGVREIGECLDRINSLMAIKNRLDDELKKQADSDIASLYQGIEMIKNIMSFNSFVDYLGGEGYLLSIDKLDNVDEKYKEDCCYNGIVPVDIINVVILKNEETNTIIDSRELLMNYFLKTIPHNTISNIIWDKKNIDELYKLLSEYNYVDYTGYKIQEVSLAFYNYEVKKIRPIVFY